MIDFLVVAFKKIRYKRHLKDWRRGKEFPYYLYPREQWPAPFCRLVSKEKLFGRCFSCGRDLFLDPMDLFLDHYDCFFCGLSGKFPVYLQRTIKIGFFSRPNNSVCKN